MIISSQEEASPKKTRRLVFPKLKTAILNHALLQEFHAAKLEVLLIDKKVRKMIRRQ